MKVQNYEVADFWLRRNPSPPNYYEAPSTMKLLSIFASQHRAKPKFGSFWTILVNFDQFPTIPAPPVHYEAWAWDLHS